MRKRFMLAFAAALSAVALTLMAPAGPATAQPAYEPPSIPPAPLRGAAEEDARPRRMEIYINDELQLARARDGVTPVRKAIA